MFINFWYVACQSSEITFGAQKPIKGHPPGPQLRAVARYEGRGEMRQ